MNKTLSGILVLGGGLLLATGCAPERPDAEPNPDGMERLAVLSTGDNGIGTDIVIMDRAGNEIDRVETTLNGWVQGLAYHQDGFFLVGNDNYLNEVHMDGEVVRFGDEPMWGGIYGVTVSDDDEVTVGNAEDGVTKLDDEGEVIMHSNMNGTCFMDSAPMPTSRGLDASIDIYGPRIVSASADGIEVIASNVGSDAGRLAVDESGVFFAGSYYNGTNLYLVEDGKTEAIGNLSSMGLTGAQYITGMETAGRDSVYVLFEGNEGSQIAEVNRGGNVLDVITSETSIWSDLVRF